MIVGAGLLKGLGRDANGGSFVLDDGQGMEIAPVDHGVAATCHAVECNADFVGHKRGRVVALAYQEAYEVLPDPLLWGQSHISRAQRVENQRFSALFFDICLYRGQI